MYIYIAIIGGSKTQAPGFILGPVVYLSPMLFHTGDLMARGGGLGTVGLGGQFFLEASIMFLVISPGGPSS